MGMFFSASTFCSFEKMPLSHIIRGRDYSSSVKNYGCQFREKSFGRNFFEEEELERKISPLRPFPGSKSKDAFKVAGYGYALDI